MLKGTRHDKRIIANSGLTEFLSEIKTVRKQTITQRKPILCDSGYTGISDQYPEAIISKKKPPRGELPEDDKQLNRRIASDRMIVENFFAQLKLKFGLISSVYRGNIYRLQQIVPILVALTNFRISKSPLMEGSEEEEDD